ncbi:MAG: ankyrin repeat domain-containing protein [Armatimonadetes bacterium]|nr:ankyrin repeat domain-containing protein [Armatimonadota bacterium]
MFETRAATGRLWPIALLAVLLWGGCGGVPAGRGRDPAPETVERLVRLVDSGTAGELERLVEEHPELLRPGTSGRVMALEYALLHDRPDVVELLLARGVAPDTADSEGRTPLHLAIELESSDRILEQLILGGSDVDARDQEGRSPLHLAARCPSTRQLRCLAENGARLDPRDSNGATPLHEAVLNSLEHADYLLYRGAPLDVRDGRRRTPLHLAAEEGLLDAVVLLVARGAELEIPDQEGRTPLEAARQGLEDLEALRGSDSDPWFGRALEEELERQRVCLRALQDPLAVRQASEKNWVCLGREEGEHPVDWFCDANSLEPSLLEEGCVVVRLARVSGAEIRYRVVRIPPREPVAISTSADVNAVLARLASEDPAGKSLLRAPDRAIWSWYRDREGVTHIIPAAARHLRNAQPFGPG